MQDADWPIRRKAYLLFALRYDTKIDKHVSEKIRYKSGSREKNPKKIENHGTS